MTLFYNNKRSWILMKISTRDNGEWPYCSYSWHGEYCMKVDQAVLIISDVVTI